MRALVLSAGGSRGAFSVGNLKHLLYDLQIHYDCICGVSVGAINAAFLGMFKQGFEQEASDTLEKWWLRLDTKKIYKNWKYFGMLAALWKPSVYDSTPLHQLLKSNLDLGKIQQSGKKICVGTVNLNSGKYMVFDQTSSNFVDAVIASASFPGMLSPIYFDGSWWSDGGSKTLSPIATAIENGATHIDILFTSPEERNHSVIEMTNVFNILHRSFDVSTDKILSNDLEKLIMYNKLAAAGLTDKKVITYNIIRPDTNLISNSLDFDPVKIRDMIDLGYNKAKLVMSNI